MPGGIKGLDGWPVCSLRQQKQPLGGFPNFNSRDKPPLFRYDEVGLATHS